MYHLGHISLSVYINTLYTAVGSEYLAKFDTLIIGLSRFSRRAWSTASFGGHSRDPRLDSDFGSSACLRSLDSPTQGSQHASHDAFPLLSDVHICGYPLHLGIRQVASSGRRYSSFIRNTSFHSRLFQSECERDRYSDNNQTKARVARSRGAKENIGKRHPNACSRKGLEDWCCFCPGFSKADGARSSCVVFLVLLAICLGST